MSGIEAILSRLERVKKSTSGASGQWMARCPAHADKGPSLSIREAEEGRILLYCHAGCDVNSVLAAISLDINDLFPERKRGRDAPNRKPIQRNRFPAADILRALSYEITLVSVAAHAMTDGIALCESDKEALFNANHRIHAAILAAGINHG